ncbi:1-acylglycerol-3-phosphate O-acyltransferase ABHD5 [Paramuricea clavata]|uniref:1-acylglycerol-3-phosphate O-acyltransferase ABHD5 n=1 Tax=Paramuricea clavata TaxID=317549 RepID=A0A7D9LI18_PARCT|nr:1-acylglycerol-3-phosphate O-acyltransferase ABHD5 [Paramuricea clavata]
MGEIAENPAENSWLWNWLKWCPTSETLLADAEARILNSLDITYEGRFITTSQQDQIWTVVFNKSGTKTPVLMIHGLGAGLGIWVMNIKELAKNRPVYTFDLLGFGRSSRSNFDEDPQTVEETFVNSIEDTIKELGLEKCILIGHSFGGYLAYAYAIKHPEHVKSLILVDPWGITEKTQDWEQNEHVPKWIKMMAAMLSPFNPYAALRFVGPLGPVFLRTTRPDLEKKYTSVFSDDTIPNYLYHCNAQTPSGETGFKRLTIPYLWPRFPMMHRIEDLTPDVKVFMLFGSRTRIDDSISNDILTRRPEQFEICSIKNAGHHVFADRPDAFNEKVKEICQKVEEIST